MTILEKLEADFVKAKKERQYERKLIERLNGLYMFMRTNREFSDTDKISIFDEIREIVRDDKF